VRRYVITLMFLALVIGSLFRAADQTGIRLMKMFGVMGIFLFGVVGTMALTRLQSRSGLKEVESALKRLEADFLITDWAFQGGGRPDYLLVGPGGLVAVCLEDMPQTAASRQGPSRIARARGRAEATVRWLRDRLNMAAPELKAPLGTLVQEVPVSALVVLIRSRADAFYNSDGVAVLNADTLVEQVRSMGGRDLLDQPARVRLTRLFRDA